MNFCVECGQPLVLKVPKDDNRRRYVCSACGKVHYSNPKIVVGTIPVYEDRILICRRAIEPRYGFWTLPAGFMEDDEAVEEAARRETREEARAELACLEPFALFSLPFVSQVYLFFRAELTAPLSGGPLFAAGKESLDVKLVAEEDIPWEKMAFTVIGETLRLYIADRQQGAFSFHTDIISHRI